MYIKVNNGVIDKYPYSLGELYQEHNQTSFPSIVADELLAQYGIYKVEPTDRPEVGFDKSVIEGQPELVGGVWKQKWIITAATVEEHLARVLFARANEYPTFSDYIDGVVKQDQAQIDKYIADCLAVKVKYPKP